MTLLPFPYAMNFPHGEVCSTVATPRSAEGSGARMPGLGPKAAGSGEDAAILMAEQTRGKLELQGRSYRPLTATALSPSLRTLAVWNTR